MAKKIISVKEAPEIDLVFNDRTYTATFNMKSLQILQEYMNEDEAGSAEKNTALILYSGICVNHPEFTLEEACALAMQLSIGNATEIIEIFYSSVDVDTGTILEKYSKKNMMEFLNRKMK